MDEYVHKYSYRILKITDAKPSKVFEECGIIIFLGIFWLKSLHRLALKEHPKKTEIII